jgi:Ca-activated chloride channel family protein
LFAERPVIVYGKWKGNPTGTIVLNGNIGSKKYSGEIKINPADLSDKNSALRYLWARKRIQMLDDYTKTDGNDKKLSDQIISLSLKYNLLTAYTSFIAIDSEVRNQNGQSTTVKQPLPLPQGVSNYAVGGSASAKSYAPASGYRSQSNRKYNAEAIAYNEVTEYKKDKETDSLSLPAEQSATFRGSDISAFKKYVLSQFKKPAGVVATGRLLVQFTINENGKLTDIKILRSLNPAIDNEITRILKNSPLWAPSKKGGKAVKQQFVMPLEIK